MTFTYDAPPPGAGDAPPSAEPDLTHVRIDDDGTFCLDDRWWLTEGEVTSCPPAVLEHLRAHPRRPQTLASVLDPQTGAAWRDVTTTVVLGAQDAMCPDAARAWAAERFDDVRVIDSDHFIPFRAPEVIAEVVLQALG